MSDNISWEKPSIEYSKPTKKYMVQKHSTRKVGDELFHAAMVLKAVRSYWEPVTWGVNLSDKEIKEYLEETI